MLVSVGNLTLDVPSASESMETKGMACLWAGIPDAERGALEAGEDDCEHVMADEVENQGSKAGENVQR